MSDAKREREEIERLKQEQERQREELERLHRESDELHRRIDRIDDSIATEITDRGPSGRPVPDPDDEIS